VGVTEEDDDGVDFHERLSGLNEELDGLNSEARVLEDKIGKNVKKLIEK